MWALVPSFHTIENNQFLFQSEEGWRPRVMITCAWCRYLWGLELWPPQQCLRRLFLIRGRRCYIMTCTELSTGLRSHRIPGQEDHLGQPQREVPSEAGWKGCFVPRHKTFQVRESEKAAVGSWEIFLKLDLVLLRQQASLMSLPQPDLSSHPLPTALVFLLVNTFTSPQGLITAVSKCCCTFWCLCLAPSWPFSGSMVLWWLGLTHLPPVMKTLDTWTL